MQKTQTFLILWPNKIHFTFFQFSCLFIFLILFFSLFFAFLTYFSCFPLLSDLLLFSPYFSFWTLLGCGYSSTATSHLQSWNGGTPRLSPPVAPALQVCDRESLRNGCMLHVLLLSILCHQIISDRISCLEIAALPRSFTSSNNCFDGCEAQRHCILSSTDCLSVCCICTD